MNTESIRHTRTVAESVVLFTDCTMIFMRLPARPRMSRLFQGLFVHVLHEFAVFT